MDNRPRKEPGPFTARWVGWTFRCAIDEFRAGWRSANPPNAVKTSGADDASLRAIAGLAILGALVLTTLELTLDGFRDWTADRPVLVGVGSAALLVAPVLYFVEHLLRQRQAEQWKTTAARAVETYVWTAGVFQDRLEREVAHQARERLGRPARDFHADMEELAVSDPGFFMSVVAPIAEEEGERIGHFTMAAVPAMTLFPPVAPYVDRFHACNDTLRQIAEQCYAIELPRRVFGGQPGRQELRDAAAAIVSHHFARQEMLMDIRLEVAQIEGINPSIAAAQATRFDSEAHSR